MGDADVPLAAGPAGRRLGVWAALAFAMTFPTADALAYVVWLARPGGGANLVQQTTYVLGKGIQFGFPLLVVALAGGPWPRPRRPGKDGMAVGLGFGLAVAAVVLGGYFGGLWHSRLLAQAPDRLYRKLAEHGMATPGRYAALAGFMVVAHSFLEEYYWRWFVYGQLRRLVRVPLAMALAGLAFMAHHVVILAAYIPAVAVVPCSLAVAVGGVFWAWLYERSGSLYPSWLSHLVVDAALFVIGWDLLGRATGG
jgi:membrane protease YdiL (CAAX protease family)